MVDSLGVEVCTVSYETDYSDGWSTADVLGVG